MLADDLAHPEQVPVQLLVVSGAQDVFPDPTVTQKRWLIVRNTAVPSALNGISQYPFCAALVNDHTHSERFQELAQVLAQHLRKLKMSNAITDGNLSIPLVFIHTENNQEQIDYGNELKAHFKSSGLACATPKVERYAAWVKANQDECAAVLIVYRDDEVWARKCLQKYRQIQQRRKREKLKIVAIQVDCRIQADKDAESLSIYPNLPIFKTPPVSEREIVQHFVAGLK